MENKAFGRNLEERTKSFAISIIMLLSELPNTPEGRVVRNQITKSGSSIGANYRETNQSRSRPDFRNKIKICASESSETVYWLELIAELEWIEKITIEKPTKEAAELLAIFSSIGRKMN